LRWSRTPRRSCGLRPFLGWKPKNVWL